MPKNLYEELADAGLEPMLGSAAVCKAEGDIARETLSRRVSRGEFPRPDRVIGNRNFWFASTVRRARESNDVAQ